MLYWFIQYEIRKGVGMKVHVKREGRTKCEMRVELPVEKVKESIAFVLMGLQKRAAISGFRPGKAPLSAIKKRYSEEVVTETVSHLVKETYQDALSQEGLSPTSEPNIELGRYDEDKPFFYTAIFEVNGERL